MIESKLLSAMTAFALILNLTSPGLITASRQGEVLAAELIKRDADGLTELHRAAGRGDTEAVKKLLDSGADLFSLDSKMGVSVLHKAVYSGRPDVVELLLDRGALINLQSPSNGNTALHDALYFKRGADLSVVRVLLKHNANLSVRNRAGLTPLESAGLLNDVGAQTLINESAAQRQSDSGRALMAVVKANDNARVQDCLKNQKVDLHETDEQGFPPLAWAAREGFTDIVKTLLNAGADPNQKDQWMGATAGHKAAFWGRPEAMKLLVAKGLDLDARGAYNGYTALMDAVTRDHFDVALLLVNSGANLQVRGHDGLNAIDIAKKNQNLPMLMLLQPESFK